MSRFKDKLMKMIKNVNGRMDDYSISPKIRQILFHWGYELSKVICCDLGFFVQIKMSYYWFNGKELLQKAKDRYHNGCGKEKAAEYYLKNRGIKGKCI